MKRFFISSAIAVTAFLAANAGGSPISQEIAASDVPQQSAETPTDTVEVTFTVGFQNDCRLDSGERAELAKKIERILARTESAGTSAGTPFVIVPDITDISTETAEGLMEPQTLIEGELTLLVKNRYDGTVYNEVTVTLRRLVPAGKVQDPAALLIAEIDPKDRKFTRFIRTSRNRIAEKYEGKVLEIH